MCNCEAFKMFLFAVINRDVTMIGRINDTTITTLVIVYYCEDSKSKSWFHTAYEAETRHIAVTDVSIQHAVVIVKNTSRVLPSGSLYCVFSVFIVSSFCGFSER